MRKIRRILVAVKDPSSRSPAVAKAAQLAKALRAEIDLFHSISTALFVDAYSYSNMLDEVEQVTRKQQFAALEKLARKLRDDGLKVSTSVEWDYPVFEAIVRRATQTKADLIVADRYAGRHLAAGILQLTDWELLRHSPVPVLLVKTAGTYRRPVVLAAVDPSHSNAKPANLDARILQASSVLSEALHGSLHALHAYIPLPTPVPNNLLTENAVKQMTARIAEQAKRGFDRLLRSKNIPAARRHLLGRHPINAIENTARTIGSSIVVMGALSRSGLKRFFIGNTAESLLDSLPCDFLIVKPADFASAIQQQRRGPNLAAVTTTPWF
jgi:universal stress protein E